MSDEQYLTEAIVEATAALKNGGLPIGAVMVKDEEIIARGRSGVFSSNDATAHAEIECIRATGQVMGTHDLTGCILYSTLEPCSMCLGAAAWAHLEAVIFGAHQRDVPSNPYELVDYDAERTAPRLRTPHGTGLEIRGDVLRTECTALMQPIVNWSRVSG